MSLGKRDFARFSFEGPADWEKRKGSGDKNASIHQRNSPVPGYSAQFQAFRINSDKWNTPNLIGTPVHGFSEPFAQTVNQTISPCKSTNNLSKMESWSLSCWCPSQKELTISFNRDRVLSERRGMWKERKMHDGSFVSQNSQVCMC